MVREVYRRVEDKKRITGKIIALEMVIDLFFARFFAEPPEIGAFSFSKEVMNEFDFAQLSCIVNSGDLPLSISWSFHGDKVGTETGIATTNLGPRMSMLVINEVSYHHKGNYTCQATNAAGTRSHTTELKINGRLKLGLGREAFYWKALELY